MAPVAANPKVLARTCAVTTALAFVTLERSAKESAKEIIFVCDRFSRPHFRVDREMRLAFTCILDFLHVLGSGKGKC